MADTADVARAERATRSIPRGRTAAESLRPYAWAFGLSGIFFVVYPALRPFSSEVGLDGARAFGSSSWVAAHTLGILGFVLLALGSLGIYVQLRGAPTERRALRALVLLWVGVGLTLPYYGAEVFGLHAVGQRALGRNDPGMVKPLAHDIRWEAGIWFILTGLLLLAIGAIVLATAVWGSGSLHRWAGVPLAAGLALYIPQFTGPQSIRIAHGLLMLAGCWWLGWSLIESARRAPRREPGSETPR
jgi:hypothetical protein